MITHHDRHVGQWSWMNLITQRNPWGYMNLKLLMNLPLNLPKVVKIKFDSDKIITLCCLWLFSHKSPCYWHTVEAGWSCTCFSQITENRQLPLVEWPPGVASLSPWCPSPTWVHCCCRCESARQHRRWAARAVAVHMFFTNHWESIEVSRGVAARRVGRPIGPKPCQAT